MLVIRPAQVEALREGNRADFSTQLARRVRRLMPDRVAALDATSLDRSVAARVRLAMGYGFSDRADVTRFVESSFVLGWDDHGPGGELSRRLLDPRVRLGDWLDDVEGAQEGEERPRDAPVRS